MLKLQFLDVLVTHFKNQTDVTIDAYIGLYLCYTHFHNMQLHIRQNFNKIYENLMKNITKIEISEKSN